MKKLIASVAVAGIAVLSLAGCGPQPEGAVSAGDASVWTTAVETPAGFVDCVIYDGTRSGAIQCDWENVGDASAPKTAEGEGGIDVITQTVSGRDVLCVTYDTTYGGGISCHI